MCSVSEVVMDGGQTQTPGLCCTKALHSQLFLFLWVPLAIASDHIT